MIPKSLFCSSMRTFRPHNILPPFIIARQQAPNQQPSWHKLPGRQRATRQYATKTQADTLIENIQELYANARDEFEIAAEETEKKTVYAVEDRAAAQEELQKLQVAFQTAVETSAPEVGAEVKARVGQRIRELENAVAAMEEMALED